MPDKPTDEPLRDFDFLEREIVYLLTDPSEHPTVWSVTDLGRELDYFDPKAVVNPLVQAGLLHRLCDGFVIATPARLQDREPDRPGRLTHFQSATSQG